MRHQVMFRRSIVGWFNVYLVSDPLRPFVNVPPTTFERFFPNVNHRASIGCIDVGQDVVTTLFDVTSEVAAV